MHERTNELTNIRTAWRKHHNDDDEIENIPEASPENEKTAIPFDEYFSCIEAEYNFTNYVEYDNVVFILQDCIYQRLICIS